MEPLRVSARHLAATAVSWLHRWPGATGPSFIAHTLALQDDGLHDRFGLHERQVRKILQDLERESLVWREKVSER